MYKEQNFSYVVDLWIVLILGLLFNLPVGWIAYKKQSLTVPGGLITAGVTGYLLFVIQPMYWVLLLTFFGSSTLLTRFKESDKTKQEAMSLAEKGGERDSFQVLANAGIPLLLALLAAFQGYPVPDLLIIYSISVATAFAVVNADTWATELGVTSKNDPVWILNPTIHVPRGTSGGISTKGLIASVLAALLISVVYGIGLIINNQFNLLIFIVIVIAGLLGSLIDSLLGATLQVQFFCENCNKMTEQSFHQTCETQSVYKRGLSWFSNDLVNLLSVVLTVGIILFILNLISFFG